MSISDFEVLTHSTPGSAVSVYCMGTLVADEASRAGHKELAKSLETALHTFLAGLSREQQSQALHASYVMALGGEDPAPPRLRLVYSRD